jgi:hypothetical protein
VLQVTCPNCNNVFPVPESMEKVFCPVCMAKIRIVPKPVRPPPPPPPPKTLLVTSEPIPGRFGPQSIPEGIPVPSLPANRGVAIMVLGIVSCFCYITVLLLFWPALVVCLVLGPLAWIMGSQDLKAIQRGELSQEGQSFVLSGYICGIVSTILTIVTLVSCAIIVAWIMNMISESRAHHRWWSWW